DMITAKLPTVMTNVASTIADIERAITSTGQLASSFRLDLQGYPSPMPPAATFVCCDPNGLAQPRTALGCPLYSVDADWAHSTLVPEIDQSLQQMADLSNL